MNGFMNMQYGVRIYMACTSSGVAKSGGADMSRNFKQGKVNSQVKPRGSTHQRSKCHDRHVRTEASMHHFTWEERCLIERPFVVFQAVVGGRAFCLPLHRGCLL